MKKLRLLGAVCACLFQLLIPNISHAKIIEFNFEGAVTNLAASLTDDFLIGESVVGSYKIDDTTFDTTDLMVTIGGDYVITANTGQLSLVPGVWFTVAFNSGLTGDPVDGQVPDYFDIQLDDGNDILQSGVLPLTYPISSFTLDRSNINIGGDRISFEVSSITTVPIPATVWLFGSGLLGLVGMARRKKA